MTDHMANLRHMTSHVRTLFVIVFAVAVTMLLLTRSVTQHFSGLEVRGMARERVASRIHHVNNTGIVQTNTSGNQTNIYNDVMKIRLLCVILTMPKDLHTKVATVNKTWATRCDRHFYVINSRIKRHDFLNINNIPESRNNLVHKIQEVYKRVYERYMNDFDYILKADDDTYVIVENLKYLLWHHDAQKAGYLGFHFNKFVKSGYMSGGAGYVISNRGLRQMVEEGFNKGLCKIVKREEDQENSEDIETGRCLEAAGVPVWSSLDAEGRETFHPYTLERHLAGDLPGYLYSWAKHPIQKGKECCSRYTISFHYVPPDAMIYLDHVLYQMTVFGVHGNQDFPVSVFSEGHIT
ncbi:glycoprotein-N-acetylgalactosamine 3-beta-galactosyltransferase 1-like [Mya arenaria]|uniref:glycoprotein-N-acetylgalactosamine 3-beta-galactosyltransferase 1-like n=1 Tax=Mya arenaria TaxID=6604 RepID=UPI0022DF8C56|nr:glycoprotein-N-acetylgalactosamine 3-beta-galactosyltransferase 1-like [Mya arenaria]XP_052762457.1 glycoprotein-N-acetylgalactosamine 3-beta-galactosyltransferase 1-like [Mya arenaria]XP_052762459.1 glycoprotein-N-acetylgalactosamine 3-beta-galactosyltransferase 1-like [Mya arenaria]XP_052762460.1 glycoprotein-N-acetylgalactosamine 3-beta-galactosyltransferase 1-like [Mya arenaria]